MKFFFVMNSDLNLFSIQIESTFFSGHPKSLTLEILLLLFGWGLFVCFVQEEEHLPNFPKVPNWVVVELLLLEN